MSDLTKRLRATNKRVRHLQELRDEAADCIDNLTEAIRNARKRCGYAGNPEYVKDILEKALKTADDSK